MNIARHIILTAFTAAVLSPIVHGQKAAPQPGVIGANDTVNISVLGADDFNKNWRVDASGRLDLPMIGAVDAGGKTVQQLQAELATRLRKYYNDPQVTVYVTESRSQPVTISGAVERPGVYQIDSLRELCQVLLLAGGPKNAGLTVTIARARTSGVIEYPGVRLDGTNQVLELPLKEVLSGHGAAAQFQVIPNDVISVSPVKSPSLVQIAGEVAKPGSIELVDHDAISLVQALAMAGGLTHTASGGKTRVIHIDAQGNTTFQSVDANKVLSGRAENFLLRPGDVVVVPSSSLSMFVQSAGLSAVTTGVLLLGRF